MRNLSALILAVAALASADAITTVVTQQVQISGTPGQMLVFGIDGKMMSVPVPSVVKTPVTVFGMPDGDRGCTATATAGQYTIPAGVLTIAVYRNGIRASLPGEFTVSGTLLTFASPIPGEVVLCDNQIQKDQ